MFCMNLIRGRCSEIGTTGLNAYKIELNHKMWLHLIKTECVNRNIQLKGESTQLGSEQLLLQELSLKVVWQK